jgi:hypothetical protein
MSKTVVISEESLLASLRSLLRASAMLGRLTTLRLSYYSRIPSL